MRAGGRARGPLTGGREWDGRRFRKVVRDAVGMRVGVRRDVRACGWEGREMSGSVGGFLGGLEAGRASYGRESQVEVVDAMTS